MTFPTVPPARAQVPVRSLRGVDQDLGARGGRAIRKVVPKILPRATQDVHFPPGGSGLRGGGWKFARRDNIYHNHVYAHNHVYDRRPRYEMLVVWLWGIFVVLDAFVSRDITKIGSMDGRNKWDFQFHFCDSRRGRRVTLLAHTPGN